MLPRRLTLLYTYDQRNHLFCCFVQCSTSLLTRPPAGNIVYNDFSSGIPFNWFCPFCSGSLTNQTDSTGTYVVASAAARGGRVDAAVGVQVNNLQANQSHYFSAWVRVTEKLIHDRSPNGDVTNFGIAPASLPPVKRVALSA